MIDIPAMRASGMTADQILNVVENWLSARREKARSRMKESRARSSRTIENNEQNQDTRARTSRTDLIIPPHPPIESKPSTSEESCEVIPFAPTAHDCPSGKKQLQERQLITEFDLVMSDGSIVITHEEFQALDEEFGITNSRKLASMAKREFLDDVHDGAEFIKRFRTFLTNNKTRKRAAKPTRAQQQSEIDRLDAEHAARKKMPKGRYG